MRVDTSVALLGVAGLGEAWRPSTAVSRRCGTPSMNRNMTLIHLTTEQQASTQFGSPTQIYDSTRRNWIQRALTFSSVVLSSAAQAALANDIPEVQDRRVLNYPVSPFRQWLDNMQSDKVSSKDGDAKESSVGASSSNDSSLDDGEASSSDGSSISGKEQ